MKLICALLLSLIFFIHSLNAQINLSWTKGITSTFWSSNNANAVDTLGNIYTAGTFSGVVDLDPGALTLTTTAVGDLDLFIQKLSPSGNLLWAKWIGGGQKDGLHDIVCSDSGEVFAIGLFNGIVDFDPGPNSYTLSSGNSVGSYFVKLNSLGDLVWVKSLGGIPCSIDLDPNGNILICGEFIQIQDFDPGPGTYTLSSPTPSFPIKCNYLLKLDQNGNFIWAKAFNSHSSEDFQLSVKTDLYGNVYCQGRFYGTADFDPSPNIVTLSANNKSIFLLKLNAGGNFVWAKQLDGSLNCELGDLNIDNSGNLFLANTWTGVIDIDPGPAVMTLTHNLGWGEDGLILKLDSNGTFQWYHRINHSTTTQNPWGGAIRAQNIALHADGNVYITGLLGSFIDFDPGPSTFTVGAPFGCTYLLKLNPNGNFVWVKNISTYGAPNNGNLLHCDISNNLIAVGQYLSGSDFDPGPNTVTLTSTAPTSCCGNISKFCLTPEAAIIGPSITCASTLTFSTLNYTGTTYTWSTSGNYSSSFSNNVLIASNVNSNGTIFLSASNSCGTSTSSIQVTYTNSISVSLSSPSVTCIGNYTSISATGANDYIWSNGSTLSTIFVAPTVTTIYTVTGSAPGCISDTKTVLVVINPISPTITITPPITTCFGYSTSFSASGATSYTWSNGSTSNIITVSPNINTTYTVYGSTQGCVDTKTTSINLTFSPDVWVASNSGICKGTSATLVAAGANSYTWNTGATSYSILVIPSITTQYTVTGSNIYNCTDTFVFTQTVFPLPTISFQLNKDTYCIGETATISALGATTYTWLNTGVFTNTFVTSVNNNNLFYVVGKDNHGCINTQTVSLTIDACVIIDEKLTNNIGILIYPNPSSNLFNVRSPYTIRSLMIEDLLGGEIIKTNVNEEALTIDISTYSNGVYFVIFYIDSGTYRYKLVKH